MVYADYSSSTTSMGTIEYTNNISTWGNNTTSGCYLDHTPTTGDFLEWGEYNISTWGNNTTSGCYLDHTSTTGDFLEWGEWRVLKQPPETPANKLRAMIQSRQAPMFIRTHSALTMKVSDREKRARDTLRRLVGESQYRKFLSHGFITARGKSGKIYQIKTGHKMTNVYTPTGQPIETLCVVLRGQFPPTDELITRFLMILNDEESFRALANVLRYHKPRSRNQSVDQRSLPAIFKSLKRQAA